jgi:hypothetical protein
MDNSYRIRSRLEAVKRVLSLLVGVKFTTKVVFLLSGILLFIEACSFPSERSRRQGKFEEREAELAICRSLPYIHRSVWKRLAGPGTCHDPVHVSHLAVGRRVERDGASVLSDWRIVAPEWSQDGGSSSGVARGDSFLVSDLVDQSERLSAWLLSDASSGKRKAYDSSPMTSQRS